MNYENPILEERLSTHGSYRDTAMVSQELKNVIRRLGLNKMSPAQKESLDLICTKIARLVCGDPDHKDSWDDIAGYAELISLSLDEKAAT